MGAASSVKSSREHHRMHVYVIKRSRSAEAESDDILGIPLFPILSEKMKESLQTHFHQTLLAKKPDFFDEVMTKCLESSSKLKGIVAQQDVCPYANGTRAGRICEQQRAFYDRLINVCKLDPVAVAEAVCSIGYAHYRLTPLGFKPHFFDIWKCHMEKSVQEVEFPSEEEKTVFVKAFGILNVYVTSTMGNFRGHWGNRSFDAVEALD